MSTAFTHTFSFAQVCAYATDKMLLSLGNIIRDSGLPMETFTNYRFSQPGRSLPSLKASAASTNKGGSAGNK